LITAWRIAKARYQDDAFSGNGGLHSAGRWHLKGQSVVYTASSLALAALEVFVHLNRAQAGIRWVMFEIGIPDGGAVEVQARARLPRAWRSEPPTASTMRIGTAWLRAGGSPALRVPSAIIPAESNLLLNPLHPDFHKLRLGRARPFEFDARLWK
jgi:RES domain-containing protein